MQEKFSLKRTVQCKKCPWKVSTNPHEIPNGYSLKKHQNLRCTIAKKNDSNWYNFLKIMACHNSKDLKENAEICIGWLYNQLGDGNNIMLRIKMINCNNIGDIKITGRQHKNFEDTIPKNLINE